MTAGRGAAVVSNLNRVQVLRAAAWWRALGIGPPSGAAGVGWSRAVAGALAVGRRGRRRIAGLGRGRHEGIVDLLDDRQFERGEIGRG